MASHEKVVSQKLRILLLLVMNNKKSQDCKSLPSLGHSVQKQRYAFHFLLNSEIVQLYFWKALSFSKIKNFIVTGNEQQEVPGL